jgi:hypothetical protein
MEFTKDETFLCSALVAVVKNRMRSRRWRREHPEESHKVFRKWASKTGIAAKRRYSSDWAKRNPIKRHDAQLKHKYGISLAEWDSLFLSQGSKCAICECTTPRGGKWATDHDHTTGKVRSILCRLCNVALGLFDDSFLLLDKASIYLRLWEERCLKT